MMINGEVDKEIMMMKRKRKLGKSVDDDGFVVFIVDYWRVKFKYYFFRNNWL